MVTYTEWQKKRLHAFACRTMKSRICLSACLCQARTMLTAAMCRCLAYATRPYSRMLHRVDQHAIPACRHTTHLPIVAVHELAARLQDGCEEVAMAVLILRQQMLALVTT